LAAPLYAEAARRAPQIADALVARSRELEEAGYHAQVMVTSDSFPLFLHTEDGARHSVTRADDGSYKLKGSRESYTVEELGKLAEEQPERFSPNVTLRAVVQDYLLPTVAYLGGAAEIAYFAQTAEVYRALERPVTPILPRSSLTVVERRTGRTLERYGLALKDLFAGYESVIARVVEEYLGAETAQAFAHTEETFKRELDALEEQLRSIDPTLAEALETGRRKINYQLEGLRTRFHRAQMGRDRAAHRQLERAITALYPHKSLQERHVNITSLLARHGSYVISWIYDAINLGSPDHQIVYL
jgi:bacillithiol biosynthesis cysteine-adding enzyme BshC